MSTAGGDRAVSSLARMLAILDLFGIAQPALTAEEIVARLSISRPTGYRYVRELVNVGLLVRAPGGYALGPRIIELDWQIRQRDPVLEAAAGPVRVLSERSGCDVTLMGKYGDRIVTIHHERGIEPQTIGFDRGRRMPLFRGAPSKAMLAFMPRSRLKRLWERNPGEQAVAVPAGGFEAFASELAAIRRTGHAVSLGELDQDKVGVAAPLFRLGAGPAREVSGAVCLVVPRLRYETSNATRLAGYLQEAAQAISLALRSG